MDISVMPLEEEVKADELDQQLEQRVRAGTSERELVDWYMSSLFAKMKIPDSVSNENNPLTIVERDSGSAAMEMEVSDSMARLQFADVEGFEPAVDAARIKKAVKHAKRANEKSSRFLAARNALRKVDSVESMDVDSETPALPAKSVLNHMVRFDVSSEPQTEEELASDVLVPSDSESDTGTGYVASDDESDHNGSDSDDAMFSGMVGASGKSRSGEPSLSLFGRLWTLVDRLVTLQTRMFLHDLKGAQSVLGLVSSAAEYNSAPGDKSMATRHSLLVGSVEREYLDLQQELRTEMDLSHEIRLLVSSLALGQNTVVFARGELRLFVLVLVFVLARSMQNLAEALGRGDVAGRLDVILRRARTERSEMEMLARRFYEAY
ncbi:hypothetical protein FBU59_001987 [Linderina macrospora]|uniref:Uncharacterized protein n=1 Tax=Linderina macrospora TaxID=4868 RepID=A0ACC1JCG2_9FUNG|nr:hypothetical protein FBU59_001987 [Linderina macrospora]